jgi:hypothetical protein
MIMKMGMEMAPGADESAEAVAAQQPKPGYEYVKPGSPEYWAKIGESVAKIEMMGLGKMTLADAKQKLEELNSTVTDGATWRFASNDDLTNVYLWEYSGPQAADITEKTFANGPQDHFTWFAYGDGTFGRASESAFMSSRHFAETDKNKDFDADVRFVRDRA